MSKTPRLAPPAERPDEELAVIATCVKALESVHDQAVRDRIMGYLLTRYVTDVEDNIMVFGEEDDDEDDNEDARGFMSPIESMLETLKKARR